jgi:hypothetical protein
MRLRKPLAGLVFLLVLITVWAIARRYMGSFLTWADSFTTLEIGQDLIGLARDTGAAGVAVAAAVFAFKLTERLWNRIVLKWWPTSEISIEVLDAALAALTEEVNVRLTAETGSREVWSAPVILRVRTTSRHVQRHADDVVVDGSALVGLVRERRHVVLLGEAGAGKTVLAQLTAMKLPGVYLPLSSWNPQVPLGAWMASKLVQDFPEIARRFGPEVLRRLVATGRVTPVLDGLDEVLTGSKNPMVEKIDNQFTDMMTFLLTSRPEFYETAVQSDRQYLSRALVVEIDPVDAPSLTSYVERIAGTDLDSWRSVIDHLAEQPDGSLATALRTPLMLYLLRVTYRRGRRDPSELLGFEEAAAIENHLLDAFVPAAYDQSLRPGLPVDRARRWLATLARGPRELRWWNIGSGGPTLNVAMVVLPIVAGLFNYVAANWLMGIVMTALSAWAYPKIRSLLFELDEDVVADDNVIGIRAHLRRYRWMSSVLASAIAIGVGGLVGVVLGGGFDADPQVAWTWAGVAGLLCGGWCFLDTVWGSYFIRRMRLALSGKLPLRLIPFLEDAHERGVLRQPGAAYQFRHARLQDRLQLLAPNDVYFPTRTTTGAPPTRFGVFFVMFRTPLIRLGTHLGFIVLPLLALSIITVIQPLRFESGEKPLVQDDTCWTYSCRSEIHYDWTAPPAATLSTTMVATQGIPWEETFFGSIRGMFDVTGCESADLEISISGGTSPLTVFRVRGDEPPRDLRDLPDWPEPRAVDAVTVTFRRLDVADCTAHIRWTDPSLGINRTVRIRTFFQ